MTLFSRFVSMLDSAAWIHVIKVLFWFMCVCVGTGCAYVGGVHMCVHAFIVCVRFSNPNLRTLLL